MNKLERAAHVQAGRVAIAEAKQPLSPLAQEIADKAAAATTNVVKPTPTPTKGAWFGSGKAYHVRKGRGAEDYAKAWAKAWGATVK
jgi:hypothetical protein